MKYFFQNIKNNIDFFLRQHLKLSRKNYFEENESKEGLFIAREILEKEKYLYEKYNLDYLKKNSTRQNYLENLYTIDLLDRYFPPHPQPLSHKERGGKNDFYLNTLNVLDLGCKNWFYFKAEYSFFKKHCKNLFLDGIEIDGNRLYSNLYSRAEVAKFHINNLRGKYIIGDFLQHNKMYDCIIWILPFVFEEPLIKWGLPIKYFQPSKMLLHAYNSLKPNGTIFIMNQGEEEYEAQKSLCEKLNISYIPLGEIQSNFMNYKNQRYSILIKKLN